MWNEQLNRIHVATLLVLALVVVGAVLVLNGNLEWSQFFKDVTTAAGLLAVGRGIATNRKAG